LIELIQYNDWLVARYLISGMEWEVYDETVTKQFSTHCNFTLESLWELLWKWKLHKSSQIFSSV